MLTAVDERHLVLVQRVDEQLDADEAEDRREAVREVDEAVEEAVDEEVELAQAEQGERVGGEHEEGLLREAEDRGDRVDREEQVRAADRDHHDEHRGDVALPVDLRRHLVLDVRLRRREQAAGQLQRAVLVELLVVARARLDLRPRGVEQERAEDVEDPAEVLDEGRAEEDEDRPQDQRDRDADEQHLLLVEPRDAEARHDEDEHEEVVDRQALLGDVAGEVLPAVRRAPDGPDDAAEGHRDGDVARGPPGGLAQARGVGRAHVPDVVDGEHREDHADGDEPDPDGHIHEDSSGTWGALCTEGLFRHAPPPAPARDAGWWLWDR